MTGDGTGTRTSGKGQVGGGRRGDGGRNDVGKAVARKKPRGGELPATMGGRGEGEIERRVNWTAARMAADGR